MTQLRKNNGRWRKATLQDLGVPAESINLGILICSKCRKEWSPLIKQDPCFDCQAKTPNRGEE